MSRTVKYLFPALIILVMLAGCAMNSKMSRLRPGMTKKEVVSILGNPNGFKKEGVYESLQYTNRLVSDWAWDTADYFAIFKDGKLTECGSGQVRVQQVGGVNTLILVPLK